MLFFVVSFVYCCNLFIWDRIVIGNYDVADFLPVCNMHKAILSYFLILGWCEQRAYHNSVCYCCSTGSGSSGSGNIHTFIWYSLTSCSKSANKLSTSCLRTACPKLSTSLEQTVNNL